MSDTETLPGDVAELHQAAAQANYRIVGGNPGPIFAALAKARQSFGPIGRSRTVKVEPKNGRAYTFNYAPLDVVLAATAPALAENGLAPIQVLGEGEGGLYLTTILGHGSGVYIESRIRIPTTIKAFNYDSKEWYEREKTAQEIGSSDTYLRRYVYTGLVCVASEEDDDGSSGSDMPREVSQKSQPTPPPVKAKPAQQSAPVASARDIKADPAPKPDPAKPKLDAATTPPQDEPAPKPATIPPPAADTAPLAPGANPDPPTEATKLKIKGLLDELGMKASTVDWCMKLLGVPPKGITSEAQQLVLLADLEGRKAAVG